MIRHGHHPFLECSTKGDKRFSALCARIKALGGRSIEEVYQGAKLFRNGVTGLPWRLAKGREPTNAEEVEVLYRDLWIQYLLENPHLIEAIVSASGLSDVFGKKGRQCQATTLWDIRCAYIAERGAESEALEDHVLDTSGA